MAWWVLLCRCVSPVLLLSLLYSAGARVPAQRRSCYSPIVVRWRSSQGRFRQLYLVTFFASLHVFYSLETCRQLWRMRGKQRRPDLFQEAMWRRLRILRARDHWVTHKPQAKVSLVKSSEIMFIIDWFFFSGRFIQMAELSEDQGGYKRVLIFSEILAKGHLTILYDSARRTLDRLWRRRQASRWKYRAVSCSAEDECPYQGCWTIRRFIGCEGLRFWEQHSWRREDDFNLEKQHRFPVGPSSFLRC